MADNRTGLSAADLAAQFRDRCGDGSMEWVCTPTQTWVLLDAADMLDENAKLLMRLNAEHLVRQNVERENAKLRELVRTFYHCTTSGECDECPINGGGPVHLMPDTICDTIHARMRELGVEVDDGAR